MRLKKPSKIATLVAVIALLLLSGVMLYNGRGRLRGPVISWVNTKLYAPNLESTFNNSFAKINAQLQRLGAPIDYETKAECFDLHFRRLKETVTCSKYAETSWRALSKTKIVDWPQQSSDIRRSLSLDKGWKLYQRPALPDWLYQSTDIEGLIKGSKTRSVTMYVKDVGDIQCSIEWEYSTETMTSDNGPALTVHEACDKQVNFFGGFTCKPEDQCGL